MFFLSSPPQPPPAQAQFLSTSTNPFAFQYNHAPNTPSLLRTSYNANGMKRNRVSMSTNKDFGKPLPFLSSPIANSRSMGGFDHLNEVADENTPIATTNSAHTYQLPTATTHSSTRSVPAQPFSFSSPAAANFADTSSGATATSRYAARSRASTPTALLQNHAAARKEGTRKRFLERLRTRRDEGVGSEREGRILRADYLEERKLWEREMRREGVVVESGVGGNMLDVDFEDEDAREGDPDTMVMSGQVQGEDDEGLSPTEEKEIEALLEMWDDRAGGSAPQAADVGEDMVGDGDSQEWDEVFMEVLSQEQQQQHSASIGGHMMDSGGQSGGVDDNDGSGVDVEMS